jgi:hypothetical protein
MRIINQIGLMLLVFASLTTIARAQSSGSTVVATCGTLATTYTPGEFQRDTQNTAGQKCTSAAAAAGSATSANQSTEIAALNQLHADMIAPTVAGSNVIGGVTEADGANVTLGAKADAVASSDTGTFSAISLIKRLNQSMSVLTGGLLASNSVDSGGSYKMGCVANSTPVTVTATRRSDLWCGTTGAMGVFLTSGPTGSGLSFYATSSNNFASNGNADKLPVMAHGLALDGTNWFQSLQPVNSASWGGLTPVANSAVASAVIGKASAGNLFGYNITTGASAGYAMVFNATTAPADGAVTPVKCVAVAANTSFIDNFRGAPIYNSTGSVVVFSTTGCFTKTASATAFISVDVK